MLVMAKSMTEWSLTKYVGGIVVQTYRTWLCGWHHHWLDVMLDRVSIESSNEGPIPSQDGVTTANRGSMKPVLASARRTT
jgi:hypothetical protein